MAYDTPEEVIGSVGPGWRLLVEPLWHLCQIEDVAILQVKEKLGGLRFYVGPCPAYVQSLIDMAETFSYRVCEVCGKHDVSQNSSVRLRDIDGWFRTLCEEDYYDLMAVSRVSDEI